VRWWGGKRSLRHGPAPPPPGTGGGNQLFGWISGRIWPLTILRSLGWGCVSVVPMRS